MKKKILCFILMLLFILNINVKAEGEATLKNIQVNKKECVCIGYECTIEVDAPSATVTYELADADATVDRLSGFTVDLISSTTLKIVVTNDKGEEKIENTYNININLHEKSSDVTLASLKVNGTPITLTEDGVSYSFMAEYSDEKLVIEAEPTDEKAKVKLEEEYDFGLENSSLLIEFEVTAENGDVKTYSIYARRGAKPNTTLKSLKLDHGNIKFDKNTYEYNLQVEYSVNDLIIEAIAADENATVKIEKEDLVVGENLIKITVTNGKVSSEYILNVLREENLDKSIANLKYIKVLEYPNLDFEENVLDYILKFDEIPEKLTIDAKSNSSDGKVEILYNEELIDGSKIVIKNTLIEAGITREYSLTITSNEENENSKLGIIIAIICLVVVIIVMLILEIKERKNIRRKNLTKILELKKKKDSKKKKPEKKIEKEIETIDDDIEVI